LIEEAVSGLSLDDAGLQRAVSGRTLLGAEGTSLELHPTLDSTNARAKELAREGAAEGSLVVAGEQSSGRGRLGRAWASPPGGLYLSLILRPEEVMLRRLPVTLLAGLAACEAIEATTHELEATLKWPNDVHVGGKKVAGILGELERVGDQHLLVLGVGINVATDPQALPEELRDAATSLAAHAEPPALETVLSEFLARFEQHYLSVRSGGGAHILASASHRMPLLGKPVRVRMPDRELTGTASGLNATGALVVEVSEGQREVVVAGEVEEVRLA
jgi:BirA family biotin operon repressor/biotin-[acetyl-CoA-carboxylase] ligase